MPDSKITALTSISTSTDPANDPLVIVDVSDTSMAATGTTKKVTLNQLLGASGTATLASATITGDLTVDTSTLKVDSANNRVGIGTASPHEILTVANTGGNVIQSILTSATGTGNIFFATSTAGVNSYRGYLQYDQSLNSLAFGINSTTAMTLNSTGLGVGGSPSGKIHAQGTGVLGLFTQGAAPAAGLSAVTIQAPVASGFSSLPVLNFWYQNTGISNPASECFAIRTNSADRLYIDSSGNVGIGVASPLYQLHVSKSQSSATTLFIDNQQNNAAASSDLWLSAYGGQWKLSVPHSATFVNPLIFKFGSTEMMRMTSVGDIVLAGGNTSANGVGITFPATQVASSDANTLDDYEEGTFTPTIEGHTTAGTASYSVRLGQYTKIGRLVQFQLYVSWSSGTGTGQLKVTGLPFTSNGTYPAVLQVYPIDVALVAGYYATASVPVGTSSVFMYQLPVGGGSDASVAYDAAGQLIITGTYTV